MIKIAFLILLIFTGCSNNERSINAGSINEDSSSVDIVIDQTEKNDLLANQNLDSVTDRTPGFFANIWETIKSFIKWIVILLLIMVIVLSVFLGYIFINRDKYKNNNRKIQHRGIHSQRNEIEDLLNRKIISYDHEISELKKNLRALSDLVNKISAEQHITKSEYPKRESVDTYEISEYSSSDKNNSNQYLSKDRERSKNSVSLYFALPDISGSFEHEKGVSSFVEKKLYKIIYNEFEQTGVIEYVSGSHDGHVISNKETMLKPVCMITENNESNSNRIKMIKHGTVKLFGSEWQIEDKIRVDII